MDTLATGDSIVMKVRVPEALGLAGVDGTGALPRDSAYALIDGPRPDSDVLDHTRLWVDRWGAPTRIRDATGHVTSTTRGDTRYPALVTRVDYSNQRVVAAEYDARGNLAAQTDSSNWRLLPDGTRKYATTRYERTDPAWPDFVTQVTLPEGEVTRMGYHTNGSPAWQQPGTSATHRASFGYNAAGQVESMLSAGATIPTRLYYDPVSGNLERMVTPLGIETRYRADELGRDTLVDAPVDAYRRLKTITRYDVMGFDTLSISDGDALEGDLYVRTERNREGQPLLVERWSTVDSIRIGTVRRSWQYDAVGRLAVEVDEADAPLRHHYDAAGNDTLTISRRSYLLRTRYDVLNRPVERITPPVTYERWVRGIAGIRARSGQVSEDTFPYYLFTAPDSTFAISGDTVKFAYDPVTGQMTQADNRYAQIRRGYNRNGTLSVDTTRVRTWDMSAWSATPHEYVMRYEYDLNGRRTRLTLPDNLAPEPGRQHQDYAYDPVWGGLRQVRSAMGLEYGFRYNLEGAADTIRYPGNRVETFSYDLDGRRTRRLMTQGSYVISDATFTLNENGSNKVVVELGALAEYINEVRYDYAYTQLGRLRQAKTKRIGSGKPLGPQRLEDYSWDALGNRWKSHVHGLVGSATHPTISWYRHGTNRVTFSTPPSGTTDNVNINQSSYDAAGNVDWFGGTTYASGDQAVHIDESVTRSYYSADEKLHAAETRRCKSEVPLNSGTADEDPDPPYCLAPYLLSNAASGSFEWYRYDALGRRIMVRTRRDPWCGGAACSSTITRFIWDGDQVLAEIRGEGGADYSETPNQTGPQYGRVVYTHGGGLDQPLDIMRSSGVGGAAILLPIPTWRGTFVTATDSAGNMVCAPWVYCEITFTSA
ncbi:MAG TPA: hypothetical protein VEY93_15490, partial [Longimicrobium sp.]|nr:hypothetical protein [Longimicrobium sp.]